MNKIDAYVYELVGFNFTDKDKEQKNVRLIETKLGNVIPMGYGYYHIGLNYIEIYPYNKLGFPAGREILMSLEESAAAMPSLLIPYQNKKMAKEIYAKWLNSFGYPECAKRVKEGEVETFNFRAFTPGNEQLKYIKRLDETKMTELIDDFCQTTKQLLENLPEDEE